jgi:hypothetical protein
MHDPFAVQDGMLLGKCSNIMKFKCGLFVLLVVAATLSHVTIPIGC